MTTDTNYGPKVLKLTREIESTDKDSTKHPPSNDGQPLNHSNLGITIPTNNSGSTTQKIEKVTADILNVRLVRGTNYSKIGAVRGGYNVTIVETKNG